MGGPSRRVRGAPWQPVSEIKVVRCSRSRLRPLTCLTVSSAHRDCGVHVDYVAICSTAPFRIGSAGIALASLSGTLDARARRTSLPSWASWASFGTATPPRTRHFLVVPLCDWFRRSQLLKISIVLASPASHPLHLSNRPRTRSLRGPLRTRQEHRYPGLYLTLIHIRRPRVPRLLQRNNATPSFNESTACSELSTFSTTAALPQLLDIRSRTPCLRFFKAS